MGVVVLSVDAELGWGFHDLPDPRRDRLAGARDSWVRLLELFDAHEVPATWAVVGHLFLNECDGTHPEHPRGEGWFDHAGSIEAASHWHGADLVEATLDADVDHEIGCHSFSHILFGESDVSRGTIVSEVRLCLELADEWGIDLESFVYPRNDVGYRDVLADHGFTCYRGPRPESWYHDSPLEPLVRATGGRLVGNAPPVVTPVVDGTGLVNIPASLFLFVFEGIAREVVDTVWADPVVEMAKRGIDRVVDSDGVVHLWLHPNNLTTEYAYERVDAVLSYLADRRRRSALEVKTMGDVARDVLDQSGDAPDARHAVPSRWNGNTRHENT